MELDIVNENIAYWNHRAPGYSQVNREELESDQHQRWKRLLTEQIEKQINKQTEKKIEEQTEKQTKKQMGTPAETRKHPIRVLDIGTGPGFFSILLTEAGYQVTAVDYTEEMLKKAKENAGELAPFIDFHRMNAETLEFPDETFDVIVSRNVTWNLPHPEAAYKEWHRVLKKGGMILNFDANWYRYLIDETAREAYESDREKAKDTGVCDLNVGPNFDRMEEIAKHVPLTRELRPAWDLEVLEKLGMETEADESVWQRVWSVEEKISCGSTPMFQIRAVKR